MDRTRGRLLAGAAGVALVAVLAAAILVQLPRAKPSTGRPKATASVEEPPGRWVAGDYHTHSVVTDGERTIEEVAARAFDDFGLEWFANSEHGGMWDHRANGERLPRNVGRWQTLPAESWRMLADLRGEHPSKVLVQGVEWNVPAHDHASVAIAAGTPGPISDFEYLFDAQDTDDGRGGMRKDNRTHASAVRGAAWLQQRHRDTSWLIVNHPSRRLRYSIADIRDLDDAAPDVCAGFEGIPGHQKDEDRGGYDLDPRKGGSGEADARAAARARTYGGADVMLAEVGGAWDALLGEGRSFWVFASSDFHSEDDGDFWPGEYAVTHVRMRGEGPEGLVRGVRSGNVFVSTGGLVDGLDFSARSRGRSAPMGGTLKVEPGEDVEVVVRFRVPKQVNANGDKPRVDHVDLIGGEVTGRAKPGSDAYSNARNDSVKRLARFTKDTWTVQEEREGWHEARYVLEEVRRDTYVRLRGTNLGLGVRDQTDAEGNPLRDDLAGKNDAARAWADLWFYSNPVFIDVR